VKQSAFPGINNLSNDAGTPSTSREFEVLERNLELNQSEYLLQRAYLPADSSNLFPIVQDSGTKIGAVRRKSAEMARRVDELDALQRLHTELQSAAQKHIDHLEWKTDKAVDDFNHLQQENERLSQELLELQGRQAVEMDQHWIRKLWGRPRLDKTFTR
jgi:hypothetical protein